MVNSDVYPLAQSLPFDLDPAEEVRIDLVLKRKPHTPATKLMGSILTCDHTPISRATVKILDREYNPVTHTLTNSNGVYIIENILPQGCYRLTAAAEGFLTAKTIDFMLRNRRPEYINVELRRNPFYTNGVIYGLTTDMEKKITLADTLLVLCEEEGKLVAKTNSNEHGQYLFPMVLPGRYVLTATRSGYISNTITVMVNEKSIIKCDVLLDKNSETSLGTISGLIKWDSRIIRDAIVGLYRIDDTYETLVKLETTNSEGLYLFTDVENGHYMVKAKLDNGEYSQEEFWL